MLTSRTGISSNKRFRTVADPYPCRKRSYLFPQERCLSGHEVGGLLSARICQTPQRFLQVCATINDILDRGGRGPDMESWLFHYSCQSWVWGELIEIPWNLLFTKGLNNRFLLFERLLVRRNKVSGSKEAIKAPIQQ